MSPPTTFRTLFGIGLWISFYLATCASATSTCVCDPDVPSDTSRCCYFTDKTLSGSPKDQLILTSLQSCQCRSCLPTYKCKVGGKFLCRATPLRTSVYEVPRFSRMCAARQVTGNIWTPYEQLSQSVPKSATLRVASKGVVDVFYGGKRIGGGNGRASKFRGKGSEWQIKNIDFGADACRYPIVVVVRDVKRGRGGDSLGMSIDWGRGRLSAGCKSWPTQLFRAKCSNWRSNVVPFWKGSYKLARSLGGTSFKQCVGAWKAPLVRKYDANAKQWGHTGRYSLHGSGKGNVLTIVAALPFCVGSSISY